MTKSIYAMILVVLFTALSCQKTNDYYADPEDRDIEWVKHTTTNYGIGMGATGSDDHLEVLVNTDLLKDDIIVEDINLKINDLTISTVKREVSHVSGRTAYFKNFSELKDLDDMSSTRYLIRF